MTTDTALGPGRIVEVANVAWPGHEPCLELIERSDGSRCLRFAAFVDGRPHPGPLELDLRAIEALAGALTAAPRIRELLARMVAGPP